MAIRFVTGKDIQKKWSRFDLATVQEAPNTYGVYEIGNRLRNVIYIGSGRIRDRLFHHLSRGKMCVRNKGQYVRWEEMGRSDRAQQRENALLKRFQHEKGQWPECNDAAPRRRR